MRILLAHNFYRGSAPSGEDLVYLAEKELLQGRGHEVFAYEKRNDELEGLPPWRLALSAGPDTVWSRRTYAELRDSIRRLRPDVVHFHNTFPQISPSAYYACRAEGAPVVHTLHNFRLVCASSDFYRDGAICELCARRSPVYGVIHGCYRQSRLYSAPLAAMQYAVRWAQTARRAVAAFITPTEFARTKLIEAGLPGEKIFAKPNFLDFRGARTENGDYLVFAGRLDRPKGFETLLAAARRAPEVRFVIAGGGPLEALARQAGGNVEFRGLLSHEATLRLIAGARALAMPSVWYETFGRSIMEAFALGKPVVASNLGAMAELVHDGETGLLVEPGDAAALARACQTLAGDAALAKRLGQNARATFRRLYTPEANYSRLMEIYRAAGVAECKF